jgi:hypothetical protein
VTPYGRRVTIVAMVSMLIVVLVALKLAIMSTCGIVGFGKYLPVDFLWILQVSIVAVLYRQFIAEC